MPRMTFFICSGICLLAAIAINAQVLPRNPTMQQLIGYRLKENRQWQARQLPQSRTYNQKHLFSIPGLPGDHGQVRTSVKPPDLQSRLSFGRNWHANWTSQRWWRNPANDPGAGILKGVLVPQ